MTADNHAKPNGPAVARFIAADAEAARIGEKVSKARAALFAAEKEQNVHQREWASAFEALRVELASVDNEV